MEAAVEQFELETNPSVKQSVVEKCQLCREACSHKMPRGAHLHILITLLLRLGSEMIISTLPQTSGFTDYSTCICLFGDASVASCLSIRNQFVFLSDF